MLAEILYLPVQMHAGIRWCACPSGIPENVYNTGVLWFLLKHKIIFKINN